MSWHRYKLQLPGCDDCVRVEDSYDNQGRINSRDVDGGPLGIVDIKFVRYFDGSANRVTKYAYAEHVGVDEVAEFTACAGLAQSILDSEKCNDFSGPIDFPRSDEDWSYDLLKKNVENAYGAGI